jgi:hypothetical protein
MISAALACLLNLGAAGATSEPSGAPETRAVAFLCREVPRWRKENRCYSCHNNGDAVRALCLAARAGYEVPDHVLADTAHWLTQPNKWDHNGGEGPFSDKRLAVIAFGSALATAASTSRIQDGKALRDAAARLAREQGDDGAWALEGEDSIASPAAYGRSLATLLARDSLRVLAPNAAGRHIERADKWLLRRPIVTVTDASVYLLAFGADEARARAAQKARCLDLLARGQADDGGWGTELLSPPEAFDTALALMGLSRCKLAGGMRRLLTRGRTFLIKQQQQDGSWIETTRPPGRVSYAHRISTTGWATLALLATRGFSAHPEHPKR